MQRIAKTEPARTHDTWFQLSLSRSEDDQIRGLTKNHDDESGLRICPRVRRQRARQAELSETRRRRSHDRVNVAVLDAAPASLVQRDGICKEYPIM